MFRKKKLSGGVVNFKSTYTITYNFIGEVCVVEAEEILKEEHQKLLAILAENIRARLVEAGRDIGSIELKY